MPQAPDDLRERWEDDCAAFAQLGYRFKVSHGGVISPVHGVTPSSDDLSAIDYLCMEWDYDYDGGAT